jgi:hypothetical protein
MMSLRVLCLVAEFKFVLINQPQMDCLAAQPKNMTNFFQRPAFEAQTTR